MLTLVIISLILLGISIVIKIVKIFNSKILDLTLITDVLAFVTIIILFLNLNT